MPTDPLANAVESFSAPIETLIIALGQGLAQAQQALDQNSIQTQETIDADPVLSKYGLQATWYQFPSVNLQLKLALSIAQVQTPPPPNAPGPGTLIVAQPLSAAYQAHFNYDAQAASQITVTLAPVPPPRSGNQVVPAKTPAQVQAAALGSAAKFVTSKDAQGVTIPAATDAQGNALRFDINFNGAAGLWYVLQYAPSNAAVKPVVVAVDDATGSVRIISTP